VFWVLVIFLYYTNYSFYSFNFKSGRVTICFRNLVLEYELFFGKDENKKRKEEFRRVVGHNPHILREFHRVNHLRFRSKKFATYLQVEEIH